MKDPAFAGAAELAALLHAGDLAAVEFLEHTRARVQRINPLLNAVVVLDWERALRRARKADDARARGESWGPLHGVPMTVKESFDLASHPTTWGDPALSDTIVLDDDLAVQRLERAGAIVFGKTNVPLRLMDFQTHNAVHGVTRNPWDLTRTAGGSSGGSAAALAAGLSALELGSDIGGSIRHPAHCCGVFGHKPTFGLVGATRSGPPGRLVTTDMAVAGPMARNAEDLAMALRVLSGPGTLEEHAWSATLREPTKSLRSCRIAFWWDAPGIDVDTEIADRCQSLADELAHHGVTVSDRARPNVDPAASHALYRALVDGAVNPFSALPHSEWRQLDNERAALRTRWRAFFRDWDVVITPVSPVCAFQHDLRAVEERTLRVNGHVRPYSDLLFWPSLATVAYLPSTAFPVGLNRERLPIGLQATGDAWSDLATIDVVNKISAEIGGYSPPPELRHNDA